MSEKTVHVAVLRGGKLAGKASADVQERISAATSNLRQELQRQIRQVSTATPMPSPDGAGTTIIPNGDGTITLRT